MNGRTLAACVLAIVSIAASVSTGLLYSNARHALAESRRTAAAGRALRKLTDFHFCRAINVGRAINNRDRATFVRARAQTLTDLRRVKDPVLHDLLVKSLAQNAEELKARPFLKPLACVKVIQHPSGTLPPEITTTSG